MALLSAEAHHLLQKRARQQQTPLDTCLCALVTTLVFAIVFLSLGFGMRYTNFMSAMIIGPGSAFCAAIGMGLVIFMRRRRRRTIRIWVALLIGILAGTLAGVLCANSEYWNYSVKYYTYNDMASYTNVDPGMDVGQSFMDAGIVYFKEGSYVRRQKALAFHNGATYCVAPIVRQPLQMSATQAGSSSFNLNTVTGFVPPASGTVDFWAVGKNCCGDSGNTFECSAATSSVSRSGMRLLNDRDRAMYLLAVQEWSASAGLPVRHPLFFEWVKDPLTEVDNYTIQGWNAFSMNLLLCFLFAIIGSFLLLTAMGMLRVY